MRTAHLTLAAASVAALTASALAPAASGAATSDSQAATYHVSLKVSARTAVAKEDTFKLSGTVFPTPPEGSKVVVQVKYENKNIWARAGSAVVKSNGSYKFLVEPTTHLDRVYRVVKRTDALAQSDRSRERTVKVFAWNWLTQMVTSAEENMYRASTLPINGDDYPHTMYGSTLTPTGYAEYTLGRDCTAFETTFGLSDRTETGGRATLKLTEDGVVVYSRLFDLGQSEAVALDVTDVYRMRLDYAQDETTPDTEPAAGSARALCD